MTIDEMRKLVADFDKLLKKTQELQAFIRRVANTNYLRVYVGEGQECCHYNCPDEDFLGWRPMLVQLLEANLKSMQVKVEDYRRKFR